MYFISRLPVEVSVIDFALTGVGAVCICLLATMLPRSTPPVSIPQTASALSSRSGRYAPSTGSGSAARPVLPGHRTDMPGPEVGLRALGQLSPFRTHLHALLDHHRRRRHHCAAFSLFATLGGAAPMTRSCGFLSGAFCASGLGLKKAPPPPPLPPLTGEH